MRNPAVNWSEGMFLRPHHFQAAERYRDELLSENLDHISSYGYGVKRIKIVAESLDNGIFQFSDLSIRCRDGTILSLDPSHSERVELEGRISPESVGDQPVRVLAGIPQSQDGKPNVAQSPGGLERFTSHSLSLAEECLGGNHQEIGLRSLNYRILFSTESTDGFELVPLAQLVKTDAGDGFRLDPNYYPPSLSIDSWPELRDIVRAIYDLIGGRLQKLAEIVKHRELSLSSQMQGDLEKMLLLHALNEAYAELSCIVFANSTHPLAVYTCLCRCIGRFSLFSRDIRVGSIMRYDHDDLATIFQWAQARIRELIFSQQDDPYEQRYFIGTARGLAVELEPEWFQDEWDWFLGVDPINLGKEECMRLLTQEIDWKLGSEEKVESYFTKKRPGVKLGGVGQVPNPLRQIGGNWILLKIRRETDAWQDVQASQTMAMRVKTEQIANLESLNGNKQIRLSIGGKTLSLEFAIFALRNRI